MPLTPEQREKLLSDGVAAGLPDDAIVDLIKEADLKAAPATPVTPVPSLGPPPPTLPERVSTVLASPEMREGTKQALGAVGTIAGAMSAPLTAPMQSFARFFHGHLPAMVDPAFWAENVASAGVSVAKASIDILFHPKAAKDYVLGGTGTNTPAQQEEAARGAAGVLQPETQRVLDFTSPPALFDMIVGGTMQVGAAALQSSLLAVSPVIIGPQGTLEAKTPEARLRASEDVAQQLASFVPVDHYTMGADALGKDGISGLADVLIDHPEIGLGLTTAVLLVAAGMREKSGATRIDAHLQEVLKQYAERGLVAQNEAAYTRLRGLVDTHVPDPAIQMLVNLMTKEVDGKLHVQPLADGIRGLGLEIDSGLDPAHQAAQANIAKFAAAAEKAAAERPQAPGPVIPSTPLAETPVGPAVLNAFRDFYSEPPGRAGIRTPPGRATQDLRIPSTPHRVEEALITDQSVPLAGRAQYPMFGGDSAPSAGPFKPSQPSRTGRFNPESLAPRSVREGPPPPSPPSIRDALGARLSLALGDTTLPPDLAESFTRAVQGLDDPSLDKFTRAVESAAKIDSGLVATQVRRLAKGSERAARPKPTPAVDAVETGTATSLPAEPEAPFPAPSSSPLDIAKNAGVALEAVERAMHEPGPGHDLSTPTTPSRSPDAAARARGYTLDTLRGLATTKGLAFDFSEGGMEYHLTDPSGATVARVGINTSDAQHTIAKAIDSYTPTPPPTAPPNAKLPRSSPRRSNRSEAGMANLDFATGHWVLDWADRTVRATWDTTDKIWSAIDRTGMIPTHVAPIFGPRGEEIVAAPMRAIEKRLGEYQRLTAQTDTKLMLAGFGDKDVRPWQIWETFPLAAEREAGKGIARGHNRWRIDPAITAKTSGADLPVDPRYANEAAAGRVARNRTVWDGLTDRQRQTVLDVAPILADLYDQTHLSGMQRETLEAVGGALAQAPDVPPHAHPRKVLAAGSEEALRGLNAEFIDTSTPKKFRESLALVANLNENPLPPRFSAYASWATYDDLTGGPWKGAKEAAAASGYDAQLMANELTDAMRASASNPAMIRGQQYTSPIDALRRLMPAMDNAGLQKFIASAQQSILSANRDVNSIMSNVKNKVFSAYFQARLGETAPEGLPARPFIRAYLSSALDKIHTEPAAAYSRELIKTIPDKTIRAYMGRVLNRITGHRLMDDASQRTLNRGLALVVNSFYRRSLLGKPWLFLENASQAFLYMAPDLMTGPYKAHVRDVVALNKLPEFQSLMLESGVTSEALPYESTSHFKAARVALPDVMTALRDAPDAATAYRILTHLSGRGIKTFDFFAAPEPWNRTMTYSASLLSDARRFGVEDAVKRGQWSEIPSGTLESMQDRAVLAVGRHNFFMGLGSNMLPIFGYLRERMPAVARNITPFTSYMSGQISSVVSAQRDFRKGLMAPIESRGRAIRQGLVERGLLDPLLEGTDSSPTKRQGIVEGRDPAGFRVGLPVMGRQYIPRDAWNAFRWAAASYLVTTIAYGPPGALALARLVDKETNSGGEWEANFVAWARKYSIIGIMSQGTAYGARKGAQAWTAAMKAIGAEHLIPAAADVLAMKLPGESPKLSEGLAAGMRSGNEKIAGLASETGPSPLPDLTAKLGPFSGNPAFTVPGSLLTGQFGWQNIADATFRGRPPQIVADIPTAASAIAANTIGLAPTDEQDQAATRLLGRMAPYLAGTAVSPQSPYLPEDIALLIGFPAALDVLQRGAQAHAEESTVPGARLDAYGHPLTIRTKTDEIIAAFYGGLYNESAARLETQRMTRQTGAIRRIKGQVIQSAAEGGGPEMDRSLNRLMDLSPNAVPITGKEIASGVTDKQFLSHLTSEERSFMHADDSVARERQMLAMSRLDNPKWFNNASTPAREQEEAILWLALQRFSKTRTGPIKPPR